MPLPNTRQLEHPATSKMQYMSIAATAQILKLLQCMEREDNESGNIQMVLI
jgi:hypothetical protein